MDIVIVHDLDSGRSYLVTKAEQGTSEFDRHGIGLALEHGDVVTVGKTVFEHKTPMTIALEQFAKANGRRWKSALRSAWSDGCYPPDTPAENIPLLQRLRNTIGTF